MFCEKCGKQIVQGTKFCKHCGAPVVGVGQVSREVPPGALTPPTPPEYNPYVEPAKKKGNGGIIAIIIVLILAIIAGLVFLGIKLFGGSSSSSLPYEASTDPDAIMAEDFSDFSLEYVSCDVSDFPNIKVYCRIMDEYGNLVTLSNPDFKINEYGSAGKAIEKTVKSVVQLDGNEGISISLIADKSYSMVNRMGDMQGIMADFVSNLDYGSGDRVEFLSFDTFVMYMCTLTDDVNLLRNGIYNMVPEGDTALYDALYESLQSISLRSGARCVICFTDGEDNQSRFTADEVAREAQRLSIPIFIIGTDDADSYTLTSLTDACGGKYWSVGDVFDISVILDEIYGNQKDMYCVEYEADSSIDQYGARNLDISLGEFGESTSCQMRAELNPTQTLKNEKHASRYEIVAADISWQDAHLEAMKKGGHLVTITSQSEMDEITTLASQAGLKYVWMGGYTSINNGAAFGHWVTGEDFDGFTAWFAGEPSRNDLDGTPEMYLMLWYVRDMWSWNDQRNDPVHESGLDYFKGNTGYVIEYEY